MVSTSSCICSFSLLLNSCGFTWNQQRLLSSTPWMFHAHHTSCKGWFLLLTCLPWQHYSQVVVWDKWCPEAVGACPGLGCAGWSLIWCMLGCHSTSWSERFCCWGAERKPGEESYNISFCFNFLDDLMVCSAQQDRTGCHYLVLAVWIGDSGHVCVGKQEVECDRQEGQVSHQGEVLAVQNFLVQPVWEGEPVQSLTDILKIWVPHTHGQVIIIQTLKDKQAKERRRFG